MYLGELIAYALGGYLLIMVVFVILKSMSRFFKKLFKAIVKTYIHYHYPQIPESELRKW